MYPLFPYTTLFRSVRADADVVAASAVVQRGITDGHVAAPGGVVLQCGDTDRKSTRLNSSHRCIPSFPTRRSSDLLGPMPMLLLPVQLYSAALPMAMLLLPVVLFFSAET